MIIKIDSLPNFIIGFIVLLMTGCSSIPASHKYVSEKHILNKVKVNDNGYFVEFANSVVDKTNPQKATAYLTAGLALSRTACYKQLDSLATNSNRAKYGQEQLGIIAVLGSGILGINGADSDNFSRIALGTAAVNSSIDLYENYYLLGPDSDVIVAKVREGMEAIFEKVTESNPSDFYDAYSRLESYSRICSSNSIRSIVRAAIQKAGFIVTSAITDVVSEQTLDEIAQEFNRVGLSNDQYFAMYWYTHQTPVSGSDEENLITTKLGDITLSDLKASATKVKALFRRIPQTQKKLQAQLTNILNKANDSAYVIAGFASTTKLQRLEHASEDIVDPRSTGSGVVQLRVK